jgi:hypothetical protein
VIVVEDIWDAFQLEAEVKEELDVLYVRVHGLDSVSLAEWLKSKYQKLDIEYKEHLGWQFSDDDWIKIKNVVPVPYT